MNADLYPCIHSMQTLNCLSCAAHLLQSVGLYVSPEQHARELREAQAEAWDEGHAAGWDNCYRRNIENSLTPENQTRNPYAPEGGSE